MERDKSIFEKIIDGEIPSTKVYEDEYTYAFLDISPVNPGHTLVIPKKFSRNLLDMDAETTAHVANTVRRVAIAVKEAVKADGINIHQNIEPAAGQVVFHMHAHVIPRFGDDGLKHWQKVRGYAEGEELEVAERIKKAL